MGYANLQLPFCVETIRLESLIFRSAMAAVWQAFAAGLCCLFMYKPYGRITTWYRIVTLPKVTITVGSKAEEITWLAGELSTNSPVLLGAV